jgi:hypothetical protein
MRKILTELGWIDPNSGGPFPDPALDTTFNGNIQLLISYFLMILRKNWNLVDQMLEK